MGYAQGHYTTDEDRRDFLKLLGVAGGVAAGGATLDEVRNATTGAAAAELAPIGEAIRTDLTGSLDAEFIAAQQAEFATTATGLTAVTGRGLPTEAPRNEFAPVAAAGRPLYEHLGEAGFFESTSKHLPAFTPAHLRRSVKTFVGSAALAAPLEQMDFADGSGVDLLSTVVANGEKLAGYHWVADEAIPREAIEGGEFIPPVTQGAAGGVLLWLEDLDKHLWQKNVLLTGDILTDAVWHARSMSVGFNLMVEGAKVIGADSSDLSNDELGALFTTGFAVQAISQNLLPQDAYWITDEMRGEPRTDLELITESI